MLRRDRMAPAYQLRPRSRSRTRPRRPGGTSGWLWHARFFKSRTLAGKAIQGGIRLSGEKTDKPNRSVRVGDVLTFQQGRTIRVIRVEALGTRRGPAAEARTLFTDLDPPQPKPKAEKAPPPAPTAPRAPAARPNANAARSTNSTAPTTCFSGGSRSLRRSKTTDRLTGGL
ncbi:MAG: RNA-binding S4 domain-containing protein [Rhodovibrio sp.]|nr:RNA-binding S4 domain-containing protein [Rhodovibrio sp.]